MNKRLTFALIIALLSVYIFASLPAIAEPVAKNPDPDKKVLFNDWYEFVMHGKKSSYDHTVIYKTKYNGADALMIVSEGKTDMAIRGSRQTSETNSIAYYTLDFGLLYSREERKELSQVKITETKVEGDKIHFTTTIDGKANTKTIDMEKGAIGNLTGLLLKQMGLLKVGMKKSFRVISTGRQKIITEYFNIVGKEKIRCIGKEIDCYIIKTTNDEVKDIEMTAWVDENGNDIKISGSGIEVMKVSREQALKFDDVSDFSNIIAVFPALPIKNSISKFEILVTVKDDKKKNIFVSNAYQKVKRSKDGYIMTLLAQTAPAADKIKTKIPFSGKNKKIAKYLKPYPYIQSDNPEIIKAAKEIVGDEKNPIKAAQLICEWIYKNIKKEDSAIGTATALETLTMKAGDCTEHSMLFCAMARSVGLPARDISGLVFTGDSFGYHAWSEIFTGKKWLPVDATINVVGTPGAYIMLGVDDETGSTGDTISRMNRMFYNTSIKLRNVVTGKFKIELMERDQYIKDDADSFENKLWGLKINKVKGWKFEEDKKTGNLTFEKEEATGPDAVFVEAGINPGLSEKEFFNALTEMLSSEKSLKVGIASKTSLKLKGQDAFEVVFSLQPVKNPEIEIYLRVIVQVRGDSLFRFIGRCLKQNYVSFKKDMDALIESAEFSREKKD